MKVVIAEGGPAGNVGSMALIENAIRIARKKEPDCEITIMSSDPESVKTALSIDYPDFKGNVVRELFVKPKRQVFVQIFWLFSTISWFLYCSFILLFTKKISWAFIGLKKSLLKEIEEADYVYCIGAERINDIYYKTALLSLFCIGTYIQMGKKVVHLSLTIGPVFNKSTIYAAKKILNKSHAIFVRDSKSYEILKQWDCKAPYVFNSYDIALFQELKTDLVPDLMSEFALEKDFICASVIHWGFHHVSGPSRQPEYNRAYADVLDYIIENYNKQIVFTPTVICNQYVVQDTDAASSIIKLMRHQDRVVSINRLLTPCELATIYSKCYFSIVTRMHAAILCSGAGRKPIIAVNYLYKLREYMKNIGFEDYSIDIDYVNGKDLIRFVDKMFGNYETNKMQLNRRIHDMQNILNSDLSKVCDKVN